MKGTSVVVRRVPFLLAVGIFGLLPSGCSFLRGTSVYPTAQVTGASFQDVNITSVTMLLDLKVKNPYPVSLPVTGLDYQFSSGSKSLLNGKMDLTRAIQADSTTAFTVPLKINYVDIITAIGEIPPGRDLRYAANFWLRMNPRGSGTIRVPMSYQGTIPIPNGL